MDTVQNNLQKRGWSARRTHADRDRVRRENQKENKKKGKIKKQTVHEYERTNNTKKKPKKDLKTANYRKAGIPKPIPSITASFNQYTVWPDVS